MGRPSKLKTLAFGTALVFFSFYSVDLSAKPSSSNCSVLMEQMSSDELNELTVAMLDEGEARPHGMMPSINWNERVQLGLGNRAQGYQAFVPWGVISTAEGQANYAPFTAEIRNMRVYFLSKRTQDWKIVSSNDNVSGRLFNPNFENNISSPATMSTGDTSTIVQTDPNHPFHFWPTSGRKLIEADDLEGMIVSYQFRIIHAGNSGTRYIFSAGGDYCKNIDSRWNGYNTNADSDIGRFICAKSEWRTAFMTTVNARDLKCV